jgi:hypothetical protein
MLRDAQRLIADSAFVIPMSNFNATYACSSRTQGFTHDITDLQAVPVTAFRRRSRTPAGSSSRRRRSVVVISPSRDALREIWRRLTVLFHRETGEMTKERTPQHETLLVGNRSDATTWDVARERLANPEQQRTSWLATVRPDGRPHLMPIIALWIDGAFYVVAGEGTRKARNLGAEDRCVIATTSTTLPSLDIVVEGRAEPLRDPDEVRRIAGRLGENGWPLEPRGDKVHGPHAPTAGPAPYTIYRVIPSKAFGLPGMYGMDQFDPADLPAPTRWDFGTDDARAAARRSATSGPRA